jgi:hypothetical protein
MRILLGVLAILAVLAAPLLRAESVNVDELTHSIIMLPNGQRAEVILYKGINYRVVGPEVLTGNTTADPDVCFESKFDSITPPDKVKLFGVPGTLIIEDRDVMKSASEFKRADNIWFCGTLRKGRDGKSIEFVVVDLQKQLPDLERYVKRIARLEKKFADANLPREERMIVAESAIDLGHRIDQDMKQAMSNFSDFDRLGAMRDKAYDVGLENKEVALRSDDADGFFALAEQWKELRRKMPKYRLLVLKCLELDPDHPRASRVAQETFNMDKYEGRWLRLEQIADIKASRKTDQLKLDEANKAKAARFKREQERAISERPALLLKSEQALCTSDPKARDGALKSFGEAIQNSVDPGFCESAIEIMVNLDDRAAVYPGLDLAAKSQFPEVRRQAYEALAWRSTVKDDQETALKTLADALKAEKDVPAARIGIEALVALGSKPAVGALVASLGTPENAVRDEIVIGLKNATKQSLGSKEAWDDWWSRNK